MEQQTKSCIIFANYKLKHQTVMNKYIHKITWVIAVLSVIAGIALIIASTNEYDDKAVTYAIIGAMCLFSSIFWACLSYIVEAALIYIEKNKK